MRIVSFVLPTYVTFNQKREGNRKLFVALKQVQKCYVEMDTIYLQ